jgi:phosphoribosylanthranilate isomerase
MFVKICGITSEDDALLAVALGADAVGFVLAPSPRQVAPQIVSDIIKRLPPEVITVGVFRDATREQVLETAQRSGLSAVQLHGHEPPELARWVRERFPMVIQAFAAGTPGVQRAAEYGADAILLDAANPGSAQVFDWSLAADVPSGQRVIVAGGLDASNVASAISHIRPWGVDVSSGVETSPGEKDALKMRDFIREARAAFTALEGERVPAGDAGDADDAEPPYDWQEEQ